MKRPTIEEYMKIMNRPFWEGFSHTIWELEAYEEGLDAIAYLLALTDQYKNKLSEEVVKTNLFKLWSLELHVLDKSDHWEEFLETIEKIKLEPYGKEFLPKYPFLPRSAGTAAAPDYFYLTEEGKKAFKTAADKNAWYHEATTLRKKGDPSVQNWFISRIELSQRIIQKKIDRQKSGKSINHLMHKKPGGLSTEGYHKRIERIRYFVQEAQKWKEWSERMKRKKGTEG
jgi:hypothetical protein